MKLDTLPCIDSIVSQRPQVLCRRGTPRIHKPGAARKLVVQGAHLQRSHKRENSKQSDKQKKHRPQNGVVGFAALLDDTPSSARCYAHPTRKHPGIHGGHTQLDNISNNDTTAYKCAISQGGRSSLYHGRVAGYTTNLMIWCGQGKQRVYLVSFRCVGSGSGSGTGSGSGLRE